MKIKVFYLVILITSHVFAQQNKTSDLLLIGGGLKICSSFSTQHCVKKPTFSIDSFQQIEFQLNSQRLSNIFKDWPKQFKQDIPNGLKQLLERLNTREKNKKLSKKQLTNKLSAIKVDGGKTGQEIIKALSDDQWYWLLDYLQKPRILKNGLAREETVDLSNSDINSQKIIQEFINMSVKVAHGKGKQKATILVSTASSNDVFDAVGFYLNLFQQKNTQVYWLPTEPTLNAVWQKQLDCDQLANQRSKISQSYDRARIYPHLAKYQFEMCKKPELLTELVNQADALFFNGGDQTLTLQSLATISAQGTKYSKLYNTIKSQHVMQQLVIGGTSAGTAVQSGGIFNQQQIPMVSNGASHYGFIDGAHSRLFPAPSCEIDQACDADELTYLKSGGFDFLEFALFDTHFTQRDRIYRLVKLLHDSGFPLGIGIDENTALKVKTGQDKIQFDSFGQGASWFIQLQNKDSKAPLSDNSYSVSVAAITNGGNAQFNSSNTGAQWLFEESELNQSVDWQDKLVKAKKETQKWQESWIIKNQKYKVINELKAQFEADWPYHLILGQLP